MSEIHRRRTRRYKFEFSFVGNDRGYLRFRVSLISRRNLRQSGNSQIPDRLGFSRHMKSTMIICPRFFVNLTCFPGADPPRLPPFYGNRSE